MKNTMKIYENGRLIEIVRRPSLADCAPKKTIEPRRSRLSKNRRGTNQYQAKRKSDYKKFLFGYLAFIILLIVGVKIWNAYFYPPIISPLADKAYAHEEDKRIVNRRKVTPTPNIQNTPTPIKDERAKKVQAYLEKANSPLADYSEYIVNMADQYDIPWTLVAAISGKESSFCKNIKAGSHNCWGIMTWDSAGNRDIRTFATWQDGIRFATKLLSENYRHDMNRAIQAKYCPSFECSNTWVNDVTSFQEEINN